MRLRERARECPNINCLGWGYVHAASECEIDEPDATLENTAPEREDIEQWIEAVIADEPPLSREEEIEADLALALSEHLADQR